MTVQTENKKKLARVIAKAWVDEDYKKRLFAEPAAVLKAEGIEVPKGTKLRVIEDAPGEQTIVVPPAPSGVGEIDDVESRLAASPSGYFWI